MITNLEVLESFEDRIDSIQKLSPDSSYVISIKDDDLSKDAF